MSVACIADLPSARTSKIRGQIPVDKYILWANSPEALNDGVGHLSILEMRWGKTPGRVAHEYLILVLEGTTLRLERDAPSWRSSSVPGRAQDLDAIEFLQKLQEGHLAALVQVRGDPVALHTKKDVEGVSALVESSFRHVAAAKVDLEVRTRELDSCQFAHRESDATLQTALSEIKGKNAALQWQIAELTSKLQDSEVDGHQMKQKLDEGELWRREIEEKNAALQRQTMELTTKLQGSEEDGRQMKQKLDEGELQRQEIEEKNAALQRQKMGLASWLQASLNYERRVTTKLQDSEDDRHQMKEKLEQGKLREKELEGMIAALQRQMMELTSQLEVCGDDGHQMKKNLERGKLRQQEIEGKNNALQRQTMELTKLQNCEENGRRVKEELERTIAVLQRQIMELMNQLQASGDCGHWEKEELEEGKLQQKEREEKNAALDWPATKSTRTGRPFPLVKVHLEQGYLWWQRESKRKQYDDEDDVWPEEVNVWLRGDYVWPRTGRTYKPQVQVSSPLRYEYKIG
ncbi:hypothetical protein JAAARDRAFT_206406 [Jaapia argillacea MUCL 33604]|uniref:Uncharacterized protein n=1 Tax=Jaapia argillacea MUCL 33604 TaxID=933084 RepID=A0A067Q7C7_9AGAM|nr:hypothetical protein JAAARDRAFT_206406 [Jaapia argillacea MUCL 33604]